MKHVFLITDDPQLRGAVSECVDEVSGQLETIAKWSAAKDALFKDRYDAVVIDYDAVKIEGLDAFILLDNILQKEATPAALVLRESSKRARQFISSLDAFQEAIELDGAAAHADQLRGPLGRLVRQSAGRHGRPAAADAGGKPVDVELALADLEGGSLNQTPLGRVLYTVGYTEADGVLELDHSSSIDRRYQFSAGKPIQGVGDPAFSTLETLASAFAWSDGNYRFVAGQPADGPAIDPLTFIFRAIDRHVGQRRVMQEMMGHMQSYPTPTSLWRKRRRALAELGAVDAFVEACDGQTTLEAVLGALGAQVTAGFKAARFTALTDAIVWRDQPTRQEIRVQYRSDDDDAGAAQRNTAQIKASKAYRAAGSGRADMERELRQFLDQIERATPYEIFDVWEGCGREVVQNKFYRLVKSHHPDAYGGNVSGDVKQLAQELFIAIKGAYSDLIQVEDQQVCADPRSAETAEQGRGSPERPDDAGSTSDGPRSDGPPPDGPPGPQNSLSADGAASQPAAKADADTGGSTPIDNARKSRIERLNAKRRATPIGLSRKPSTSVVTGKTRKSTLAESSEERRRKVDKIRRGTGAGSTPDPAAGASGGSDEAKRAFNEGYQAYREKDNVARALDLFSTAYDLEPDNGTYMTFYGYLLFLNDADKLDQAQAIVRKAMDIGDRQSLPDAHVFMGHLLKVQGQTSRAMKHFKAALKLNPKSREAQRELRLNQSRQKKKKHQQDGDGAGFLKNLFND